MNTPHTMLNADFNQRCVVNSHTLDWLASPAAGV